MKIGILCNGKTLNAWEAKTLDYLIALEPKVELVLAIVDTSPEVQNIPRKKTVFEKLNHIGFSNLLYYFYCRYLFKPTSTKAIPIEPYINHIKKIHVDATTEKKGIHRFPESVIEKIKNEKLDFILRFGFNILKGGILDAAKYGIWSYHHDDEEKYRGGPPAFWEIYSQDPVTGSILQRLTEKLDSGHVLKKGYFKTITYSAEKNLDQVYFESAKWPALLCTQIKEGVFDPLKVSQSKTSAKIYRSPKNHEMIRFLYLLFKDKIIVRIKNWLQQDIWVIGLLEKPIHSFLLEDSIGKINILKHKDKNSFIADSFGIEYEKKLEVFCEEYSYTNPLGKLCHFSLDKTDYGLNSGYPDLKPIKVKDPQLHHSYPYVYKNYIIPECYQSKKIEAKTWDSKTQSFTESKTLISDLQAVDPTLFEYDGKYWLTFTLEDQGPNSHLYIWYCDSLFGEWKPHKLNPVKIDIRNARPAGTVFMHNGKYYRPAQDCAVDYGYRVNLNEIIELTPERFEERIVKTIGPLNKQGFTSGLHTISAMGGYTLIDIKKKEFVWPVFRSLLKTRMGL